jgi:hypothetical protein
LFRRARKSPHFSSIILLSSESGWCIPFHSQIAHPTTKIGGWTTAAQPGPERNIFARRPCCSAEGTNESLQLGHATAGPKSERCCVDLSTGAAVSAAGCSRRPWRSSRRRGGLSRSELRSRAHAAGADLKPAALTWRLAGNSASQKAGYGWFQGRKSNRRRRAPRL